MSNEGSSFNDTVELCYFIKDADVMGFFLFVPASDFGGFHGERERGPVNYL